MVSLLRTYIAYQQLGFLVTYYSVGFENSFNQFLSTESLLTCFLPLFSINLIFYFPYVFPSHFSPCYSCSQSTVHTVCFFQSNFLFIFSLISTLPIQSIKARLPVLSSKFWKQLYQKLYAKVDLAVCIVYFLPDNDQTNRVATIDFLSHSLCSHTFCISTDSLPGYSNHI